MNPFDSEPWSPPGLTLFLFPDRFAGIEAAAASEGLSQPTRLPAPMSEAPAITLYRLQACPFCERVVRVLDEYDLDHRSRFVEPLHSRRNVVKRVSGKRTVPAIVDENTGVTMSESANIVDYLDNTYGDGARTDEGRRAEAERDGGPN